MLHTIAGTVEIHNVEAVEVIFGDTEELWISAETSGPIGADALTEVLLSLPVEDLQVLVRYDAARPTFAAPDESGDQGFLQWWYLPLR